MKIVKFFLSGALFIAFMLFADISSEKIYANNLILTGDSEGLKISSADSGNPLAMLFSLEKMTPGDAVSSTITINNVYEYAFSLSVKVEDLHNDNEGLNLSDQFIITIEQDGVILTAFPKTNGVYYFPDMFAPKSTSLLTFTVSLPGEVGNEYQNTSAELQWTFNAERTKDNPDPPDPPDPPNPPNPPNPPGPPNTPRPPSPPKPPSTPNPPITPDFPITLELTDIKDAEIPLEMLAFNETSDNRESGLGIMPKTGEASLWIYVLGGSMSLIIGFLLLGKKRVRNLITAVKNLYKKEEN